MTKRLDYSKITAITSIDENVHVHLISIKQGIKDSITKRNNPVVVTALQQRLNTLINNPPRFLRYEDWCLNEVIRINKIPGRTASIQYSHTKKECWIEDTSPPN